MKITVKLLGTLGRMSKIPLNGKSVELEMPEGSSVRDIVLFLGIPLDVAKVNLINGKHSKLDSLLADGDTLSILPPIAGG